MMTPQFQLQNLLVNTFNNYKTIAKPRNMINLYRSE